MAWFAAHPRLNISRQLPPSFGWEPASPDNNFVSNHESYWDKDWQTKFGGVDHPMRRRGYWPAEFKPRENPFYVALPYGEFVGDSQLKSNVERIPWYRPGLAPLLKNHWVEVLWSDRSCFAQWEDVGPVRNDDFEFVFGDAVRPLNTLTIRAGLDDLSRRLELPRFNRQLRYGLAFRRRDGAHRWSMDRDHHHIRQQPLDILFTSRDCQKAMNIPHVGIPIPSKLERMHPAPSTEGNGKRPESWFLNSAAAFKQIRAADHYRPDPL